MASSIPQKINSDALKVFKASARALRELKKVDPRERYVLLIPEAKRVHVGMGYSLINVPLAEQVFEKASDIVNKDILKLCLDGPKSELLDSMENRHLASFVTSHATIAKLESERPDIIPFCKAAGGFGVGFVNALVFGGAMTFENGLDLVRRQGIAMDRAAKVVPSARVKVRFMPATSKKRVCQAATDYCVKQGIPREIAICNITNQEHAHVLEIAGHEQAIKYLETEGQRLFKFRWISRIESRPQAFQTSLMNPAKVFLQVYIDNRMKEDPDYLKEPVSCSTYSSNAGYRQRSVKEIRNDLITYPVRSIKTEQLLHTLYQRPRHLPQPNTLVLWDRILHNNILAVNRLAWNSAKLFK